LDFQKQHNIVTSSYGGLSPVTRLKDGPLDPVLETIAKRLSTAAEKPVTEGQVLQLWLLKKGVPCITYVGSPAMFLFLLNLL
jgi:diketogulonate reductase-like aldo/keto reductase